MVKLAKDNEIHTKILLWGMAPSGKTSFLEILHNMAKEENIDIRPTSDLAKISMASGATLYFDRAIFQSTLDSNEFYHVYTVPGVKRLARVRKRLFGKVGKGINVDVSKTDGIIFCVNASKEFLRYNILFLKELVNDIIKKKDNRYLIKDIPLVVILNKRASDDSINKILDKRPSADSVIKEFFSYESFTKKDVIQFLTEEG
ncbi:MAG: hypothetical protein ACFFA0_10220, partial [Promethearchaeota archaeon]